MQLTKRVSCLALAAVMTLLLSVGAFAAHAVVSPQKLEVDGKSVSAQAYNIDGSNYFKLRDIAALLNGTDAQFSVGYDETANAISVTTGEAYASIGEELAALDGSGKEAVESKQALYINGNKYTNIKAYNIDGYNYFKLRDLGRTLRFGVGYDEARNTVTVRSDWKPDVVFTSVDMSGKEWNDMCFADGKLTMVNYWAYWCGPCVGEMPDLEQLSHDYADRGLKVIGLYDKSEEKQDKMKVKQLGVTYPCLQYTSAFDPWLDTGYIPVTIFVNSEGKVVGEVYGGSRSYSEWAEIIDSML